MSGRPAARLLRRQSQEGSQLGGNSYETFAEAYRKVVDAVLQLGHWVEPVHDVTSASSQFGTNQRRSLELLGNSFVLEDPRSCLFVSEARKLRLGYAFGSVLWTLKGSRSLREIDYYNPNARLFSDDGRRLFGAFGPRLQRRHQLDGAVGRLRRDPNTRRAIVFIGNDADTVTETRDFPCAVAIHYFIREGRLHSVTFMRSQSVAMVLPYDVFLFSFIHCWVAERVGVPAGPYHHVMSSAHIYEDEIPAAKQISSSSALPVSIGSFAEAVKWWPLVVDAEGRLRRAATKGDLSEIRKVWGQNKESASTVYDEAIAVLTAFAAMKLERKDIAEQILERVSSSLRSIFLARADLAGSRG
jgi:thymidylate synthase